MRLRLLLLVFSAAAAAFADSAPLLRDGGPLLGFTNDSNSSTIRPIRGIPGAALIGDPVDLGFPITLAAISPSQDFALAVSSADELLRLVYLAAAQPPAALNGALLSPDRIVFSPSGSAAMVCSENSGRCQALTGLPQNPVVQDLSLNFTPQCMAISDDGAASLISGTDDGQSWFYDGAVANPLPVTVAAAQFRRGTHDALAVTSAGDVYWLQGGGQQWLLIHSADDTTRNPAGVQLSTDGTLAYVAAGAGKVSVFNLASGASNTLTCNCAITGLQPLNAQSVYDLTGAAKPPLWLFDASQSTPRLWFVPGRVKP